MIKNQASQVIGCQMVSASDGSAFTGSVTVYVTGDAGTQAAGSVGSGACTHEGNGYHTYAPAQAETNYNLIAFTFVGTGAIPSTVQVFTISFDPHDTVRLGLTSLPNAAADGAGGIPISDAGGLDIDTLLGRITGDVALASVCTETRLSELDAGTAGKMANQVDIIQTDTTTDIPGTISTMQGNITDILADTDELQTNQGDWLTATGFMPATEDGSSFTALPDVTLANGAHGGAAASITLADYSDFQGASSLTAADIADAIWDETLSDHLTAGSTGNGLNAAGSAGDPWSTALPGAYGAGTAGKIIGDNINATISSRSDGTGVTLDAAYDAAKTAAQAGDEMDLVDAPNATAVTAIQNGLATGTNISDLETHGDSTWATATGFMPDTEDGSSFTNIPDMATATNQATIAGYIDTEVAAILEDTGMTIPGLIATAQADLDTITGADGVTLATAQGNYAPAVAGDEMDIIDAPNATAVTAIQNGLATSADIAGLNDISAADVKTAMEAPGSSLASILTDTGTTLDTKINTIDTIIDELRIALVNKKTITIANGNTEYFDASDSSLGSVASCYTTDGTYVYKLAERP